MKDFQDSPDDEENARSSQEYMTDIEEEYQARALLAKSKRFFKKGSLDENEGIDVKALMALTDEERVFVCKECASNDEWVKISIQKVPPDESQRNQTDPPVAVSDSLVTDYDLADESSVCNTPLPPLEKLAGAILVSRLKTIKLNSKSTFKTKALKGVIINEPSSACAKGNISTSVSKTNSTLAGKLKNVKMEDNPPLAIVMKERNELKLQISKNKSSYSRNKNSQQVNQHHTSQGKSFSRFKLSRPTIPFPSCIHYRGIKPKKPQHVIKNCETCGSNVHTTTDNNDNEWFRKSEVLQAKKAEIFKTSKTESSSALRSKTPTKR
nr:hypothetical protein [Tanacetum cinerariifolium]